MFQHRKTVFAAILALFMFSIAAVISQDAAGAVPLRQKLPYFGFAFTFDPELSDMRIGVHSVVPAGPAQASGLRPDDSITAVDGKRNLTTAYEVLDYISRKPVGSVLKLDIVRDSTSLSISIVAAEANDAQQARTMHYLKLLKAEHESSRKRK